MSNNLSTDDNLELHEVHSLLEQAEQKLKKLKIIASTEDLNNPIQNELSFESMFQYSVILPSSDEHLHNTFVIGNFQIHNTGAETMNNPLICLEISPSQHSSISGKISYGKGNSDEDSLYGSNEEWKYLEYDWRKKGSKRGEHWLKPLHADNIAPGETLTFSNFQLKFSEKAEGELSLAGFVYCKEDSKGRASKNRIVLHLPSKS
ncbi:hypothetical protein [Bacillus solimangrovi]|uniref:Uncharacterized protein n=1 Tax=Bacillus solimangrovi TaxID=1305675 RepID=A0A1E5LBY3_9BACI|nr:hypothetical protein [Bacillus solimangrovi]OEH91594.1 hypothetical protein BFG57_04260 [Bacillus solimangrovi]